MNDNICMVISSEIGNCSFELRIFCFSGPNISSAPRKMIKLHLFEIWLNSVSIVACFWLLHIWWFCFSCQRGVTISEYSWYFGKYFLSDSVFNLIVTGAPNLMGGGSVPQLVNAVLVTL